MKRLGLLLLAVTLAAPAFADEAEGCADHPLFNRIKGYELQGCEDKEFDEFRFPVAPAPDSDPPFKQEAVEGRWSQLRYGPPEGQSPASSLQVIRNFQNAAKAAGGTVVGEFNHVDHDLSSLGGGSRATTLRIAKSGKEAWVLVLASDDGPYSLTLVEREAMRQDVVANELLDKLNKDGFVALYINFDTGKATIKPESQGTVDEVAKALKSAPDLKLEVGGHTDNVGQAAANQALSEARAKAVQAALVAQGIAAARLSARGYGDTKPIADNRSEEGRAKNRRVELTKK